jgi:hypothetical protein
MVKAASDLLASHDEPNVVLQSDLSPSNAEVTDWNLLTRIPLKAERYRRETYFREGLEDARESGDLDVICRRGAVILVKPDGIISGKIPIIIDYLRRQRFAIVATELVTLGRLQWREMWRYQLTSATLDRLAINDLVLRGSALLLLLRHSGYLDVPASVWLSGLKGPSDVSQQSPDCLRRVLGQPNRVISFIHVADEPADVLRELAILTDRTARRKMWSAFARSETTEADENLLNEVAHASANSFRRLDTRESLRRLEEAAGLAANRQGGSTKAEIGVRAAIGDMHRGRKIAWRTFVQNLASAHIDLDPWDLVMLGAAFIVYDEPGHPKSIQAVDAGLWRTKSG